MEAEYVDFGYSLERFFELDDIGLVNNLDDLLTSIDRNHHQINDVHTGGNISPTEHHESGLATDRSNHDDVSALTTELSEQVFQAPPLNTSSNIQQEPSILNPSSLGTPQSFPPTTGFTVVESEERNVGNFDMDLSVLFGAEESLPPTLLKYGDQLGSSTASTWTIVNNENSSNHNIMQVRSSSTTTFHDDGRGPNPPVVTTLEASPTVQTLPSATVGSSMANNNATIIGSLQSQHESSQIQYPTVLPNSSPENVFHFLSLPLSQCMGQVNHFETNSRHLTNSQLLQSMLPQHINQMTRNNYQLQQPNSFAPHYTNSTPPRPDFFTRNGKLSYYNTPNQILQKPPNRVCRRRGCTTLRPTSYVPPRPPQFPYNYWNQQLNINVQPMQIIPGASQQAPLVPNLQAGQGNRKQPLLYPYELLLRETNKGGTNPNMLKNSLLTSNSQLGIPHYQQKGNQAAQIYSGVPIIKPPKSRPKNCVYDPLFEELGLHIDPHLRLLITSLLKGN